MERKVWTFGFGLWVLFFIAVTTFAQVTFERTYGGTDEDLGYSVLQTLDGGYIIAGVTNSFGIGNEVYLIKTNASGDTLWTRTLGGGGNHFGYSVQETSDGGYIIAGETNVSDDVYLVKTNASGDTLWTRTYGGGNSAEGHSVQETSDGGYIIAGDVSDEVYLIKTNASGDTLWTQTYGGGNPEEGHSVQQTTDGGFIITGLTCSFGAGGCDVYLIKTDSLGDTLWTKTYGGTSFDGGTSVQQTSDGGFIITGTTFSFGAGDLDVYLIKTNFSGDTLWTRTYGGASDDWGSSVQQTSDGGYSIAGWTLSFGAGVYDVYLIKTDSIGDTLWTRTYGGTSFDRGYSVQQTMDGGFIITGRTFSFGAGLLDVYLIKTDGNGLVGIEEEDLNFRIPSLRIKLYQNQPNPFASALGGTVIGYSLPKSSPITLKIYDLTGRLVKTLVDKRHDPGVYQIQWDGKDQISGIYFYRLSTDDNTLTKKMILLR